MKKRMAVFVFYDKDNIVDEYVYFLLKEIKKVVSYLVVVCNGYISEEDNHHVREYAEDVFERENIGYDAGAIKDVVLDYVGIEKIKEYEELLITNDTIYGPLYPLSEVFEKMEHEDVDFWGLTQVEETEYSPNYLQSYFLLVRSKLLHSIDFVEYWEQMRYCAKFEDVLYYYEQRFTIFFSQRGYRWTSYIDISQYCHKGQRIVPNPYYHIFEESMSGDRKLPFIKRKPLVSKKESQGSHSGILFESYVRSLRECEKCQYFNFNMIWDNLLRVYSLENIQKGCNLTYLLSTEESETRHMKDTLIIIRAKTDVFLTKIINECRKLVQVVDVWLLTSDSLRGDYNQYLTENENNLTIDMCSDMKVFTYIAEADSKYTYVCYIDTQDFENENWIYTEQKARFLCCFENLVKNNTYVSKIHSVLEKEDRLGVMFPPQIFEQQILKENAFFSGMHSFWVKGKIFYSFVEYMRTTADNQIGEALAEYAKIRGYYSGIVKNDEYAVVDAAMKEEYLIEIVNSLEELYGEASFFDQKGRLIDQIMVEKEMMPFIKCHDRVYMYGAGEIGQKLAPMLPQLKGFIVSDGHKKRDYLYDMPIIYFSEYKYELGDGIILALNSKNSRQVLEMFEQQNLSVDVLPYKL